MLDLLCRKLWRNPSFLRNIDRNTSLVRHFFSTEALDSTREDRGKGVHSSRNNDKNPRSSVAGEQDSGKATKTLLRRYGFKDTHLSKLHTLRPHYFTSVTAHKLLLPKLEFYRGLGRLLDCSLENQIVPCYSFIKKLLLLSPDDDEGVVKRCPRLITTSIGKTIAPNVAALRAAGVPHSRLLPTVPATMGCSIKEATEMGFVPNKNSFVYAVKVFVGMSKSTRDKKMEVYRKCGMTDEEIPKAFGLFPMLEGNIVQTMDFVVKKMGWQPGDVARFPPLLGCSLEKRTIPRCKVVRYLQGKGKGLLKKSSSFGSFLSMNEKDKFVKKYEDHVPGLMDFVVKKMGWLSVDVEQMVQLQNFLFFITFMVVLCGTAAPVLLKWFFGRDVSIGAPFFNGTVIPILISLFLLLVYLHSRKLIRSADGAKSGVLVRASRPLSITRHKRGH